MLPNLFQLGNGSWIAFGQNLTIVEKPQVLSYLEEPKGEVSISIHREAARRKSGSSNV